MAKRERITATRLREVLRYNPHNGLFYWRQPGPGRAQSGVAGSRRKDGYITINVDHGCYLAHRLAWLAVTGIFPDFFVDHINGQKDDNRWRNLRLATNSQNLANKGLMRTNTTGFPGIYRPRQSRGWIAQFRNRYLGTFDTRADAAQAYCRAAMAAYGPFAHPSLLKQIAELLRMDLLSSLELPLRPQTAVPLGTSAKSRQRPRAAAAVEDTDRQHTLPLRLPTDTE